MKRAALGCMAVGCLLLPVVTLILVLKFVSDRRPARPALTPIGSPISVPPPGQTRVLARKIADGPNRLEWQWTIVGDRNWSGARAIPSGFQLMDPYPFNSRSTLGGTHIWIVDLSLSRNPAGAQGIIRVDASIHGSNGATVRVKWESSSTSARPLSSDARIQVGTDTLVRTPFDLTLASVGDRPLRLNAEP